jgi:2-phosphoglycerate kinase
VQVIERLDSVLEKFERQNESVIIEVAGRFPYISDLTSRGAFSVDQGVHLSTEMVIELMRRHQSIVPFLIFISNETKHYERFAVRSRYMALDPNMNKYIKHFGNIRMIQKFLCKKADNYLIPKIDNTNVDRSIATIHSTLVKVLRKVIDCARLDPGHSHVFATRPSTGKAFWIRKSTRRYNSSPIRILT